LGGDRLDAGNIIRIEISNATNIGELTHKVTTDWLLIYILTLSAALRSFQQAIHYE
jgi:hypothetical protein